MFIVENGISSREKLINETVEDDYRIDFMRQHFIYMKQAAEEGVDLLGYCWWSPIDLVSQSKGEMEKRYGLIFVDYDNHGNGTGRRYPKKSYHWYRNVISSNGENL